MTQKRRMSAALVGVLACFSLAIPARAQQAGGILKLGHFDSPASMSMLEESTVAVNRPMMGVFNNLVIFKQDEQQNTPRYDRPGARDSVGLERGRHRTDVFAAPRRQVA